jgi:hypothetical protein
MRVQVQSTGEVEIVQSESVTGLANMFSDDLEAKEVASKLLQGKPSDDLLAIIQNLKKQILPWHDESEEKLKTAIEEISSCNVGMENGMRESEAKKESCSGESTSHTAQREDESTKFTTKEHWKAETAEKYEDMTTECNAFQKVADEAKSATASYGGGDAGVYLENVLQKFCEDLLPRYKEHKQKCATAKAEHVRVSEIYEAKITDYEVQKKKSDATQTEMDVTCCEYSIATKDVCVSHGTCYQDKVAAYKDVEAIIQAEEKTKKVEWRVCNRIECLLPILGTSDAHEIEKCRVKTHDTGHLNIAYPAIPANSTCPVDLAFPGTETYYTTHFGPLPENAKGKDVDMCTGMIGGDFRVQGLFAWLRWLLDLLASVPLACPSWVGETEGLCVTNDHSVHRGACYDPSEGTTTQCLQPSQYDSYSCPSGTPKKCFFPSSPTPAPSPPSSPYVHCPSWVGKKEGLCQTNHPWVHEGACYSQFNSNAFVQCVGKGHLGSYNCPGNIPNKCSY